MELTKKEIKLLVEILTNGFPTEEKKRELMAKIWKKLSKELE